MKLSFFLVVVYTFHAIFVLICIKNDAICPGRNMMWMNTFLLASG
jgi:hypothetical protein